MKIFILVVAALIVVVMSCGFLLPEGEKGESMGIAKKGAEIVDAAVDTVEKAKKPKRKSKAVKILDKFHDPKKSRAAKLLDGE